jgi:galactose-1-phosphate uridylyltransferase
MEKYTTLFRNALPGEIDIHSDILSVQPVAISRKRGSKVGKESQKPMEEWPNKPDGRKSCIFCHPAQKELNLSLKECIILNRVADFVNDFPYMHTQRVVFLWHDDEAIRENCLHRVQLDALRKMDLYWLLNGCLIRGREYKNAYPDNLLKRETNPMAAVVGFNFGKLAGQSQPHIHAQCGYEVVLNPRRISQKQLALHYEELHAAGLILYGQDDNSPVKVIVPWTPLGQFAIEIHFTQLFEISNMSDHDIRIFTVLGHAIIQKYLSLGIQNLNIAFSNSPVDKQLEPLRIRFVPRTGIAAFYEIIKGVGVVDTHPSTIVEELLRRTSNPQVTLNWSDLMKQAETYDPDAEFIQAVRHYSTQEA